MLVSLRASGSEEEVGELNDLLRDVDGMKSDAERVRSEEKMAEQMKEDSEEEQAKRASSGTIGETSDQPSTKNAFS